jgi:sigma-B regulation protein RsbU (phosphoserine phosphatase)
MSLSETISALRGPWVRFVVFLALVASLLVFYAVNIIQWRNSPDFGWRTMYETGPNFVAEVFQRGKDAGLQVGDVILSINGQTYATFDDLYFRVRSNEPGLQNTYTVSRKGLTLQVLITTGRLGFPTVLKRSGPIFVLGLIYALIGVLVFLMKPKAGESWLFLVMTCILGMVIGFGTPSDLIRPLWFFDIRLLITALLPAPIIHLAVRFPKARSFLIRRPWLWIVPYLFSCGLFVVMQLTSTAVWDVPHMLEQINLIYLLLAVLVFLVSMVWNFSRDTSVLIRLQSKSIFLGMLIGIFIPVSDLIARIVWNIFLFPDPALGLGIFLSLFPLSIGYTIVKHDLFAIDAIIKRTYGYVLTTGSIAGLYGVFVLVSNLAFGKLEVTQSPMFPLIFILAVVFFFNPVRNRIQKFIDRVFYRLEYDYQDTVRRISETMRSLLHLDEIGKRIMETALGAMFIDSGCIMLLNPATACYESLVAAEEKTNAQAVCGLNPSFPSDNPFIQKMAERKKHVTVYDIQTDPFFEDEKKSCEEAFSRFQATLIVPLVYEDRLTGLIVLGKKKSGKFYRREDINLLNTLANQGAVAIENARMIEEVIDKERMEEELSIARDLQTSMLPAECPKIEGIDIAAYSVSAREVGGDFYDFIEMGKDKVGLVVADVTGKSVSGALVMSASRSVLRMLSEEGLGVGETMIKANRRTKKDIKSGMFVALLYAVIDVGAKMMHLCSAGQTQPIHLSVLSGKAELVETEGDPFPLGILDDADYQETKVALQGGDAVVFYTDGIVEAMNSESEMFGFDRLLSIIQEAASLSAESVMKLIMNRVEAFVGGTPQHDDITVIVVRVEGSQRI